MGDMPTNHEEKPSITTTTVEPEKKITSTTPVGELIRRVAGSQLQGKIQKVTSSPIPGEVRRVTVVPGEVRRVTLPTGEIKRVTVSPLGESVRRVTSQLLESPTATDMVATDVRTPPRVKHRVEESQSKAPSTQAPSSEGLSTWILLSEQSTIATKKKPTSRPSQSDVKKSEVNKPPVDVKPTASPPKKLNNTKEEITKGPLVTLHDSKFKNRTPVVVGRVPLPQKNKTENSGKVTTPTSQRNEVSTLRPMVSTTARVHLPDTVPTTSLLLKTDSVVEETSEEPPVRKTPTKKKKKNKNRRRPKPESTKPESKVDMIDSKIETPGTGPLSTRIYNYLAREVMPSVGVGLVGLVLTAGLAGLLLYPFGGGVTRRNYEKVTGPSPDAHMYYYNDYTPGADLDRGNLRPEETVLGQVLSGMSHKTYSEPYDLQKYKDKYSYDTNDYAVNGYAGTSDYSTLPESVKNSDYSSLREGSDYYGNSGVSSATRYETVGVGSQPGGYDSGSRYPGLTEYTAYTNAASVGTSGTYDNIQNENNSTLSESEVELSDNRPQSAALISSPQMEDFVGSVSVSGSYGTQVRHRSGISSIEHGPRSLEPKTRKTRELTDESANEIQDSSDGLYNNDSSGGLISTTTDSLETITTTKTEETTKLEPTESSIPDEDKHITTPRPENTTVKRNETEISFVELFRKLAQVKLQLGINLLRSTSETFQRYLQSLTNKMETAVRNLEKSDSPRRRPPAAWGMSSRRVKREAKRMYKKKAPIKKYQKV